MAKLVDDLVTAGGKKLPEPMPTDIAELLELMDDAAAHAAIGTGVGGPTFDHGMRLFAVAHAHCEAVLTRQLENAHRDLTTATRDLTRATRRLSTVTLALVLTTVLLLATELPRTLFR